MSDITSLNLNVTSFADDITVINSSSSFEEACNKTNRSLNTVEKYFRENCLKEKTAIINFQLKKNGGTDPEKLTGFRVIKGAKILGLFLDADLKWSAHLEYVVSRVNPDC